MKRETPGVCGHLDVYECPLPLIELAIDVASDFVTVENFRPTRVRGEWLDLQMQLYPDDAASVRSVANVQIDLAMAKEEFKRHLHFWDQRGVYAVFTHRGPLKFRASDLEGPSRYRALSNYGWTLELDIPGPSGGEWGTLSSPNPEVLRQIYEAAVRL